MMVLFYFITAAFLITMSNASRELNPPKYLYMADDQNNMRRVYNYERVDREIIEMVAEGTGIIYYLHSRANAQSPDILVYEDKKSVYASHFDPTKVTVFLIHGWLGNRNSTINTLLTEAFLQDADVNIIVVDWCEVACDVNYVTTVAAVPVVGRNIGKFITWLATLGLSFGKVHLVGHSLGAHVAGNAGRETKAKIQRITGLDPAGPLWKRSPNRLVKSDSQYVEIIHTNTDCLGIKILSGDADFFPNGGGSMPGCIKSSCSHSKAYYYMADTVKYNNLYALKCDNMDQVHSDTCKGEPYLMGNSDLSKNRTGIFRVNTDRVPMRLGVLEVNSGTGQKKIQYRRFVNSDAGAGCI